MLWFGHPFTQGKHLKIQTFESGHGGFCSDNILAMSQKATGSLLYTASRITMAIDFMLKKLMFG